MTTATIPATARRERSRSRDLAAILGAATVAALLLVAPSPAGLSPAGQRAAALAFAALILWCTEPVPIAVTALLVVMLQPLFGLATMQAATTSFISPVFFFVLVMFVIAQAFTDTGLDRRFAFWLLSKARGSANRALLLFMTGTAALSTIVSDVPCAAVFMAIALGVFDRLGLEKGQSQFARAVMIGIPIASLIGGVGTPAGSSVNILGLFFIEKYGHVRVPFLHWMAVGMPMVVLLVPVAARVIAWFYPPEFERLDRIDFDEELRRMGPLTAREGKFLAIMATMLALWIANTWIPAIDVVVVAVCGAAVMFLPGIRLFSSWADAQRGTAWDTLLMIGSVTSLGAVAAESGLAKWLVDSSLGAIGGWPPVVVLAAISAFIVVVHLLVPVNPAIVATMVPPVVLLATSTGQNPALYGLPVVFTTSCAFLLPLDAVPLVTYSKGYYRMFDMLLPGLVISVVWVILVTALLLLAGPGLGLI